MVDGPDLGEGCRWAGDVVEAFKGLVVGAGAGPEDESAGNEAGADLQFAICNLQLSWR